MIKLNLKDNFAAQDMIRIIMKEKGLSAKEAIAFSISLETHKKILKAEYVSIALELWGHDDLDRKWYVLEDPTIELDLGKLDESLVKDISDKQNVDIETAICYFLIFTMESLGYHI